MDMATIGKPDMTIGGRSVKTADHEDVINPANGEVFASAPLCSPSQIDEAVDAARNAFPSWASTPIADRQALIRDYAQVLRDNIEVLATTLTLEQGKPLPNAESEINGGIAFMESYCQLLLDPEILRDTDEQYVELRRSPLGVVAAITAWNYPALLALWKIGPALVAGNTLVLKPAPSTPLTTLKLGELAQKVFPAGVLNVINGDGEVGSELVKHPDIRKIAFTGSTATGKKIMEKAGPTLKRLTLELGGNDAGIVLPDVDVAAVADDIFWAKFSNCGQVCAALKRLFIHDSIYDALIAELVKVAQGTKIGDGFDDGVVVGPVQNKMQHEKLAAMVAEAKDKGATLLHVGDIPEGNGFWFPITLLGDVPADADVVKEEAFGPILTVHRYSDPEEALARANATSYGLGASVWAGDVETGAALAERMEAGTTWVNQHPAMGPDIPFGGIKCSGLGVEGARWGLEEYTNVHVVNVKKA